jgi:pyruvate dehydrogenase E2 component (dihydrolipoamide acetyltransferase)
VLKKIVAAEDDTVEVGGELAVIGEAGESDGEPSGGQPAAAEAAPTEEEKPAEEPAAQPEPAAEER